MNEFQKRVLECAIEYAKKGWNVLPIYSVKDGLCECGKPDCISPGKHPATVNGVKDASTDVDTIRKWFSNGRTLNIGIAAGSETGLVMLDVDPKNGGNSSIQKYDVPETLIVRTGSGGRHYYFFYPQDKQIRNSAGKLGPGLDVRSNNGYVVAPPSVHQSGNEYRWMIDPRAMEPAKCPEWMVNESINIKGKSAKDDEPIESGKRNDTLTSIAGAMRRQGCDTESINAALISINQRRCRPPLGYDELKKIAESIGRYPPEEQKGTVLNDDHPETIVQAFIDNSNNKYRYNSIDGWSELDNNKYTRIDEDQVQVDLRRFLNNVLIRKKAGDSWVTVKYRRSNSRIKDIISELAATDMVRIEKENNAPASLTGELDPDNIIAMNNCLLDVSGKEITKKPLTEKFYTLNYMPYGYEPEAKCPVWIKFLENIFQKRQLSGETDWSRQAGDFIEKYEKVPDQLAISILQEWFGYLLTPNTHLQKIFALIGERRSGKSTIGKVLRSLVGSQNAASPTLTSLATEFGLQALVTKTVAIIGDANTSSKGGDTTRAVERLKSISGEDGQQINRKNKAYIEVEKLSVRFLLIANKMQDLRDSTGALASRFNFLVTTQSFLGREDMFLEQKLLKELPGIFNWAIEGLVRLKERGYIPEHPAGIDTRNDFEEMSSPMKAFINDCCVVGDEHTVPVDILWKAHCRWAEENGNGTYSKRKFIVEIKGVCCSVHRDRQRVDLSELMGQYNWDNGLNDNRMSVLCGIDLCQDSKNIWDNRDIGTGYGTGYPTV